jgi:virginiamycin B lyase
VLLPRRYFVVALFLSILIFGPFLLIVLQVSPATNLDRLSFAFSSPQPLLPYALETFHLPSGSSQPWGITSDRAGRIWFVEESSNQIGMFDPASGTFSEYAIPTPNALAEQVAVDNSGNVWFSELNTNKLGELKDGTIQEFAMPLGPDRLSCGPIGVTADAKGDIWVTCEFSNQIDEFIPSNATFNSYDLPVFFSAPLETAFDSSGNFWFTAADSDMIGYATVQNLRNGTSDGISEFAPINQTYAYTLANPESQGQQEISSLSTPSQIAISPDGSSLWITEHTASSFDEYRIATKTLVKYFTSQTGNTQYSTSLPNGIGIDSRGTVWIAEHYGNRIAEFDPSTGQMIEYPIPCCADGIAGTLYLTVAPDGSVWFSEFYGNAIGELKPQANASTVSLKVSPDEISANSTGSTVSATLDISFLGNFSSKSASASFTISGISTTGSLPNATASFQPSSVALGTNSSSILSIKTNGLKAGIYYLTVGAKFSPGSEIYSTILKMTVAGGPDTAWRTLLLEGAIIGGVASVVVVGALALIFRQKRSRRRRGRSHR